MKYIYSLTSPSGKVYIGQTTNLKRRLRSYRLLQCAKQRKLFASLTKYTFEKHVFKILHELPNDVSQETLNIYECVYIEQFQACGFIMLNLKGGGHAKGTFSAETCAKISASLKGKKASPEAKARLSIARRKRITTEATCAKISAFLMGKKRPPEVGIKIGIGRKGIGHTEESRKKMSESQKKRIFPKGFKLTEEHKQKLRKPKKKKLKV